MSLKETGSAAPGFGASTPAIAPNKTAASAGHRGFGESVDALSCPLIARGCTAVYIKKNLQMGRVSEEGISDAGSCGEDDGF